MGNNNEMLRQMQARISQIQEELAKETVEGSAGGGAVKVVLTGMGMGPAQVRVQSVTISPDAVDADDVATLEDLVLVAFNEALSRAQTLAGDRLSALTGGMRLPGLF